MARETLLVQLPQQRFVLFFFCQLFFFCFKIEFLADFLLVNSLGASQLLAVHANSNNANLLRTHDHQYM